MRQPPYVAARRVFWIVDNGSSHRGSRSVERLQSRYPNLLLVHAPVHASWLNQIEIYFSILQRKALVPNDFTSLETLNERIIGFQHCRVGGGAPQGWPPSAAQTQRAVFPHWAFTKAAYLADAIDGISPIRFTSPISPYRIVSGSSFHPELRQRLRLWDHIRWTIQRFKRLKSLRTWALQ
jgi:hypothetical protein